MDHQYPTVAKIPVLDTGKFKQWQFRIQQYLQHEHYALWEVIEFRDSYVVPANTPTTDTTSGEKSGRTVTLTAEDMQRKKNDVKARTTLLLSLPDEHQLRFSKYKIARELWAAILKTVNEIEKDDLNQKFLTSLAPEWLMHIIVWRNMSDLDTMSLDDLYNHLKVYESEVQKKSEPNSQKTWPLSLQQNTATEMKMVTLYVFPLLALMAPRSQNRGRRDNYRQGSKAEEQAPKALMAIDGVGWDWSYMANDEEDHALVADEVAPIEFALMENTSAESKKLETLKQEKEGVDGKLTGLLTASKDLDNLIESQRSDKNKEGLGYTAVPPPPAQLYLSPKKDLSWTGLPECADDTVTDYSRLSPTVESTSEYGQNRNPFVYEDVASPITPKPFIKFVKPKDYQSETQKVPLLIWEGREKLAVPKTKLMTKAIRTVAALGGCKITGKGTIKTGKLEFKNVYFVKDLKYNLFSVSQICDNKNSVMFIDSECIVLGKDFKLLDDANILLRTPRQHNMYSIDLNNIIPHKDLTCLVAKASADECMLWHMRLGHLNFKTMNELVRHNLVRGLPTKCFKNDHTCTACLKGKQHKASCKSKLVNSVTKPLYTLNIDLFGPTSPRASLGIRPEEAFVLLQIHWQAELALHGRDIRGSCIQWLPFSIHRSKVLVYRACVLFEETGLI
uniref:Putative ribonuclease H-like domain-containing protein n=1 Tax=Tanacetum cinerariifolium TaxID=118510 RepID=A0A6L2NTL3_TANCI|nr:putative ribonuclease H-like domain-containing protein [Tanacetum cinerariifolium]